MNRKLLELYNLNRRISGITMPITRKRARWNRNWPCMCGSGKKFKMCCMVEIDILTASDGNANVATLSDDIQKMVDAHRKK